jgi:hypothetical protein
MQLLGVDSSALTADIIVLNCMYLIVVGHTSLLAYLDQAVLPGQRAVCGTIA